MEKTISRILEIEEKARVILNRATEQKAKLHDEYELKMTIMEKEIADKNVNKIKEFKASIDKELQEDQLILIQKQDKQLKEMEDLYTVQHNDIVNQLFDSIIRS